MFISQKDSLNTYFIYIRSTVQIFLLKKNDNGMFKHKMSG